MCALAVAACRGWSLPDGPETAQPSEWCSRGWLLYLAAVQQPCRRLEDAGAPWRTGPKSPCRAAGYRCRPPSLPSALPSLPLTASCDHRIRREAGAASQGPAAWLAELAAGPPP